MSEQKVSVTPTPVKKSRGILGSIAVAALGFIPAIREFFVSYPEAGGVVAGLWGILVRVITKSPLKY